ncbi:MAG: hypothetical protein LQ351_007447 [Letrouitia transgressa]|nr:MAG: hypothetical protein LQ351_007447 [Letrouitia transgressa]
MILFDSKALAHSLPEFLGVKTSAPHEEIIKAHRRKSKQLHPDKVKQAFIASRAKPPPKKRDQKVKKPGVHVSKPPSEKEIREVVNKANDRYARLGVIAEILKGSGRERYDYFLAHGFPKWKGSGYYYNRFKPGLGTVLCGLFVLVGGLAHYVAMYLGWKRQKSFVEAYIRHARRAAWGDDSAIGAIPGVNGVAANPYPATGQDDGPTTLNRRQKRLQEKESRKEKEGGRIKGSKKSTESTQAKADSTVRPGARKRVQAENGKLLIVDSAGNVFLEEENENGQKEEYLLDPEEIPKPTIQQTLVFQLPLWLYSKAKDKFDLTFSNAEQRQGSGKDK